MSLTPKQERFAQCIADGMSQSDAYRESFDVRPTTKPESVQVSACRLMADPNVTLRVQFLKQQLSEKALWSREDSVRTLAEIALKQGEHAKDSDRVAAVKALNSMHGWDAAQKHELSGPDGAPIPIAPTVIELVAPAIKPE